MMLDVYTFFVPDRSDWEKFKEWIDNNCDLEDDEDEP